MPCDTKTRPNQTLTERKIEVREAIARLSAALVAGKARAVIDRATGAVAFAGTDALSSARVTDACAFKIVMATGFALARQEIAKAEALAGRTVSRQALAQGIHAHADAAGTLHWHHGH